jgi:hypothetical protein
MLTQAMLPWSRHTYYSWNMAVVRRAETSATAHIATEYSSRRDRRCIRSSMAPGSLRRAAATDRGHVPDPPFGAFLEIGARDLSRHPGLTSAGEGRMQRTLSMPFEAPGAGENGDEDGAPKSPPNNPAPDIATPVPGPKR